jgi:hypothetical protein
MKSIFSFILDFTFTDLSNRPRSSWKFCKKNHFHRNKYPRLQADPGLDSRIGQAGCIPESCPGYRVIVLREVRLVVMLSWAAGAARCRVVRGGSRQACLPPTWRRRVPGGRRTEDRRPRTDDRGPTTKDRRPRTAGRDVPLLRSSICAVMTGLWTCRPTGALL